MGLCDRNCVILRTNGAKEIMIFSMKKVFLEHAVIELVYNFDEKSTTSVSTAKVPFKLFWGVTDVYTYIYTYI